MEVVDAKDVPSVPLEEEATNGETALVPAKSERVAIREMWEFACVFDFFRVCAKSKKAHRGFFPGIVG